MIKRKKTLFLIILLLFVVLIIVGYFIYKKYTTPKKDESKLETYNEMMEEMVMPSGIFDLKKNYKGENELRDFYKTIKRLGEYTKKISTMSSEDVTKEKNTLKRKLEKEYGVTNPEDVIEYYKGLNIENVYYATIDTDSFKKTSKALSFNMTIDYNNGDKKVNYLVELQNRLSSVTFSKYTLVK